MKLVLAENEELSKIIARTHGAKETSVITAVSEETEVIIRSIRWTELRVAVGNEKAYVSDLIARRKPDENDSPTVQEVKKRMDELREQFFVCHTPYPRMNFLSKQCSPNHPALLRGIASALIKLRHYIYHKRHFRQFDYRPKWDSKKERKRSKNVPCIAFPPPPPLAE